MQNNGSDAVFSTPTFYPVSLDRSLQRAWIADHLLQDLRRSAPRGVIASTWQSCFVTCEIVSQCNVANPDPEHCSTANQQASTACNANAEFKSKILDVIATSQVSWSAK